MPVRLDRFKPWWLVPVVPFTGLVLLGGVLLCSGSDREPSSVAEAGLEATPATFSPDLTDSPPLAVPAVSLPVAPTVVAVAPTPRTVVAVAPAPRTVVAIAPAPRTVVAMAPTPRTVVAIAPAPRTVMAIAPAPRAAGSSAQDAQAVVILDLLLSHVSIARSTPLAHQEGALEKKLADLTPEGLAELVRKYSGSFEMFVSKKKWEELTNAKIVFTDDKVKYSKTSIEFTTNPLPTQAEAQKLVAQLTEVVVNGNDRSASGALYLLFREILVQKEMYSQEDFDSWWKAFKVIIVAKEEKNEGPKKQEPKTSEPVPLVVVPCPCYSQPAPVLVSRCCPIVTCESHYRICQQISCPVVTCEPQRRVCGLIRGVKSRSCR